METTRWTARVEMFEPASDMMMFRFLAGPLTGRCHALRVTQPSAAVCDLIMGDQWTSPIGWRCVLEFKQVDIATWVLVRLWSLAETRSLLPIAPDGVPLDTDAPVGPDVRTVSAALRHINRHRDEHALRRLDPVEADWTGEDVVAEARRLGWRPG